MPVYLVHRHTLTDLLCQRIFQVACGYIDGNDANRLRRDPMFKLAVGRAPLSEATDLASGPTFSRLENSLGRKDIYRLAKRFVEAFIASYAKPPQVMHPLRRRTALARTLSDGRNFRQPTE